MSLERPRHSSLSEEFPTPERIYRVGHTLGVWTLPEWQFAGKDGRFDGRWDDPQALFRVRYAALTRFGAFVERVSRCRPDLDMLALATAVENALAPVFEPGLPDHWFATNSIGESFLDVPQDNLLVDLATGPGMGAAHPAIEVARRSAGYVLRDYDASVLMSSTPRAFTQAIARYIYEAGYAGIVYLSRFAPDQVCIALFEGRHELVAEKSGIIDPQDEALLQAIALHHLALPVRRPDDPYEPASSPE